MKTYHFIYIPGLGDDNVKGQSWAVKRWQRKGVTSELVQMKWSDYEAWQSKLDRVLASVDAAVGEGKKVAIIGASAGASAAINVYSARSDVIVGVLLIAGKANHPERVGTNYKTKNPAFWTSVQASAKVISTLSADDRKAITARYGIVDEVVLPSDSKIAGARNRYVPSIGHVITIATQLLFGIPSFLRFIKRLSR